MMRMALWFGLAGAALRTAQIIALRVWHVDVLYPSVVHDPVSLWLAEEGVTWFFDPRRIYPGPGEALLFEVFLVLGCVLQCAVLGIVIQAALRARRARRLG